jgi:protein SCO1/2
MKTQGMVIGAAMAWVLAPVSGCDAQESPTSGVVVVKTKVDGAAARETRSAREAESARAAEAAREAEPAADVKPAGDAVTKMKVGGAATRAAEPAADEKPAGDAVTKMKIGGAATRAAESAAAKYFTSTELVDQHGRPHRVYEDLIRGRKVLINFAFTSCKGVCPGMTANLARVQRLLGARVGKEISILTLTVDPVNDTPAVLAEFAAKFHASPGWYFLTGTPDNVATVLGRLGGLAKKPEEHAATLLIGDAKSGYWMKTVATARPEDIVYLVDHVADERDEAGEPGERKGRP